MLLALCSQSQFAKDVNLFIEEFFEFQLQGEQLSMAEINDAKIIEREAMYDLVPAKNRNLFHSLALVGAYQRCQIQTSQDFV